MAWHSTRNVNDHVYSFLYLSVPFNFVMSRNSPIRSKNVQIFLIPDRRVRCLESTRIMVRERIGKIEKTIAFTLTDNLIEFGMDLQDGKEHVEIRKF